MAVTVIIPSYNRAHLLPQTVPSYFQEGVDEVILVDDCSTDATPEVAEALRARYPGLRYLRQPQNRKQAAAKNRGIDACRTEWIYFGDDDSVLVPGSIRRLCETAQRCGADAVGAKALYMNDAIEESVEECVARLDVPLPPRVPVVDLATLTVHCCASVAEPVEVPAVQASALVRTELARTIRFDPLYKGNAFREETDFFIRCHLSGAKIMYDSRAVQVNLPRRRASGGAHAGGRLRWYRSAIENNGYFLRKNWDALRKRYPALPSRYRMQVRFVRTLLRAGAANVCRMLVRKLKRSDYDIE